ncbi:RDD family protein [Mucilaginibacter ginsenosidivorax]|uniref:RDD family protein n=1 Tax=Mucilaginibacter ginsenosidivorax TaxID=862126 RepID=A0A5B8W7V1_9SPHI|nr:RDD family protein [Mucilaginibacter ginsenosidivorax]QEC79984.1 RDD family protein [Mucilaginibacter ginsenosidivorax]
MINEYYILRGSQQDGPYTHTQLMDMNIEADDFLLSPLADGLQYAADLPEFQDYFISKGIYLPDERNVANFWWRLLAYIIDYALLFVATTIGTVVILLVKKMLFHNIDDETEDSRYLPTLISVLAWIFYNAVFEATKLQASIGKIACKMIVVDARGQRLDFSKSLARNFGKILSSLLCGVGFLTVLWSPMHQAWHDQLAKTYVVRKS